MSVLAWWVIPVTIALLVGAIVRVWGRRPRFRRSFEEVEYFQSFLDALERQSTERAERVDRTTA
jgi:hypothetical protein